MIVDRFTLRSRAKMILLVGGVLWFMAGLLDRAAHTARREAGDKIAAHEDIEHGETNEAGGSPA